MTLGTWTWCVACRAGRRIHRISEPEKGSSEERRGSGVIHLHVIVVNASGQCHTYYSEFKERGTPVDLFRFLLMALSASRIPLISFTLQK